MRDAAPPAARTPRVSVGLPVHNGEPFLTRALDTLLAQTVTDIEVVVSDNCSTDGTEKICREYADRDPRVRYERHGVNRGAAWNFNRVLARADPATPYFLWAAADDEHAPGYLEATVALLDADDTAVGAHTATADIDDEGYVLHEYEDELAGPLASPEPAVRFGAVVALGHQCFPLLGLLRHDVLTATRGLGGYSDSDNVLLAEIVLRGRIVHAPQRLFQRRQHPQRSMRSFTDQRERTAWFDPSRAGVVASPMWRLVREFVAAVRSAPLAPADRRACYQAFRIFLRRNWLWFAKSVVRSTAEKVGAGTRRAGAVATGHRPLR